MEGSKVSRKKSTPQHDWLVDRGMTEPSLVMRIDNYSDMPLSRGQFVPEVVYPPDATHLKAIWPTKELACGAAEWAAKKFGHVYAVFTMIGIVEQAEPPLKITEV